MTITVGIVEDSRRTREGLQQLINATPGLRCEWAVASAEEALMEAPRRVANVILMDIHLPRMSGIECTQEIKRALPETDIIMLTVYEDNDRIFRALQAGACGYLLKRTRPEQLMQAIKDVHQGGAPMTSEIARRLVEVFQQKATGTPPPTVSLSRREKEILELISHGYGNKEVAGRLSVSVETVRHHLKQVYQKFHVHSRTEAVLKFMGLENRSESGLPRKKDQKPPA